MNKKISLLVTLALAAVASPAAGEQPPVAGEAGFLRERSGGTASGTPLTGNPLLDSLAALDAATDPGQDAADTASLGDTAQRPGDTAQALATPGFEAAGQAGPPRETSETGQPGGQPGEPQRLGRGGGPAAAVGLFGLGKGGPGGGSGPAMPNLMTAGDMIGFSRDVGEGVQAITIINASRRWMAVYHLDNEGRIRLMSSRPLDADFTIQFNATSPLPEEIRRLQGK